MTHRSGLFHPALVVAVWVGIALSGSSCSHSPPKTPKHSPRLVLISIDGLRPAFYTHPEYRKAAPTLARMSDEGERAPSGIEPVFPSITYPNHVAMVTGAYSDHNGIYSNEVYSKMLGVTDDWYFYADEIHTPTLWSVAHEAGLKVALIGWPASVGARVNWNMPEIFYPGVFNVARGWVLVERSTEPRAFLREIQNKGPLEKPSVFKDLDQLSLQAFDDLIDRHDPDLILIHLVNLDYVQHQFGTGAPEVTQAVAGIDQVLEKIVSKLDPAQTTVIVTGDHGFATYRHIVHIAPLIREAGVQKRVVALADGGQSAIYQLPGGPKASAADCARILKASRKYGDIVNWIPKRRLHALHAYPRAICAFEAKLGYVISGGASVKVLENTEQPRGHHGYLPNRPEMRAGFLIWGKAVSNPVHFLKGDSQGEFKMIDIAPTAAAILGIPFDAPDGTAIRF